MHHILTQATGRGTLVCRDTYHYKGVMILAGFESNGADIPRIFRPWYSPFYPDWITAIFFHDYLCHEEKYAKADRYFHYLLIKSGVSKRTRMNLVRGVRVWHKVAYRRNKPRRWLKLYNKLKGKL